jgi:hypothetical protein
MGPVVLKTESFDKGFANVVNNAVPTLAGNALFQWGLKLIQYAIMEPPRAPHKSGHLWDTQLVEKPVIEPGRISVKAGFAAEYAAAVHEAPDGRNWTLPDSGPKFLSAKLANHINEMPQFVAEKIREGAR